MVKSRRFIITIAIFLLLIGGYFLIGRERLYETSFLLLFDTRITVMHYANSAEEFDVFAELVYNKFERYHRLFDIYRNYEGINNIKTINDNAGVAAVKVDEAIIKLLLFGKEQYDLTGGAVNIALGPVLRIWHKYRTEGHRYPELARLPSVYALEEAFKHSSMNDVIIDMENSTVFLPHEQMSLDVGAVAKGFAVQRVAESMQDKGYDSFLINAGGDVKAVGMKRDNTSWNVGIANPAGRNELAASLRLSDMSAATSGDYLRYYTVGGQRFSHIIDPATLFPATNFRSVTVITENAALADSLSIALFIMSYEEGTRLIESMDATYAIWIDGQLNIRHSKGAENILR